MTTQTLGLSGQPTPPTNEELTPPDGETDRGSVPAWFQVVYWPFFAAVFLFLLLLMYQLLISPREFYAPNLLAVGFAVLIACVALWIGDVLHYVHLSVGVRRSIFVTFVMAVLGGAAAVFINPPPPLPAPVAVPVPVIRELKLFQENAVSISDGTSSLTVLAGRQHTNFSFAKNDRKVGLLLGFVVNNLQTDTDKRIGLKTTLVYRSPKGSYDVAEFNRTTLDEWKSKGLVKQLDAAAVEAAFGGLKANETLVLAHVTLDARIVEEGLAEMRVLVRDELAHTWSEKILPFSMTERNTTAAQPGRGVTK